MLIKEKATVENPRRVIINTDANNEIDDQMAIVHALLSPELKVEGIVAAHYGKERHSDSMERSYGEILKILKIMGMEGKVPVYKGSAEAIADHSSPQKSEGMEFTIEMCLAAEETPLYVAYLGPITDMASAYLIEPEIAKKTVALWIGGGWWPNGGWEFNAKNDWIAGDIMFQSDIPLIQYPRGTYRMMRLGAVEMEENIMGKGFIGDYLTALFKGFELWKTHFLKPRKWWVYGDSPAVGTLINPDWGFFTITPAPRLTRGLEYKHIETDREIEVCVEVTAGEIFEDFYEKLRVFASVL